MATMWWTVPICWRCCSTSAVGVRIPLLPAPSFLLWNPPTPCTLSPLSKWGEGWGEGGFATHPACSTRLTHAGRELRFLPRPRGRLRWGVRGTAVWFPSRSGGNRLEGGKNGGVQAHPLAGSAPYRANR